MKKIWKNHKVILFILVLSLVISIIFSILFTWLLSKIKFETFRFSLISWIIIFISWPALSIFLLIKIKVGDKKGNKSLASSRWMNDKEFNKKYKKHEWDSQDNPNHGFLLKTELNSNGKLKYQLTSDIGHALVVGATRSGKTSMLVNPNIQTLAKSETSLIISDPKGELFETHSKSLADQGYEVLSLNLRNHEKSNNWNPLTKAWDLWFYKTDDPHVKEMKQDEAITSIKELSTTLFPNAKGENPIWTKGASTIFQFLVIGMLELSEYDEKITRDNFNITNILTNLNSSTYEEVHSFAGLLDLIAKETNKVSKALAIGGRNVRGAEETVSGMVQNAVTALEVYSDSKIKRIVSSTNLKVDPNKKQAIFIIVPDEDNSKNGFVSLFVSEIYKELISLASANGGALQRPFYFILDEFGNIPAIPNFDAMITVGASRKIFFMPVLQNYQQMEKKYSRETSAVIRSNCAYEFYLLTNDHETAEKFSKKLGEEEIDQTSQSHSKNGERISSSTSTSKRTRRLMDANELMKIGFGDLIVTLSRSQPIKSSLAKFWEFKGFKPGKLKIKSNRLVDYDKKYIYKFIDGIDDNKAPSGEEQKQDLDDFEENSQEAAESNKKALGGWT